MEQSRTPQSELLQNRLRDHKAAETVRESRRTVQEPVSQRATPGRDDDIFTDEEQERHTRKSSARQFQSSPAGPSSWRYDRDASRNRRATTGLSSSTSNTPRAMGVREMEEHIDKLSKQNFDLKMEVFHRREKIEQLEKKLQDYPQLEEDLSSALDANDDLVSALEARDRAVDEAVVMISELERKNRDLEQQLAEAKASAARVAPSSEVAAPVPPQSPGRRSQRTPRKSRDRRSVQGAVSPDVSARMVELSKPAEEREEPHRIPSFIQSTEPTTAALRSMYVDGDQVIRPIPSYATLLSNVNSEGNEEDADQALNSPRLSELSESDLRSIYGKDDPPTLERNADKQMSAPEAMSQQTDARTTQWVTDRAISPAAKPYKSRKSTTQDDGFQSLDHVLIRQSAAPPPEASAKPNTRLPRVSRQVKDERTPPLPLNPVFGQNTFPPTPDTMVTRPSNNSTTSFGLDSYPFEATANGPIRAPVPTATQNRSRSFLTSTSRWESSTPTSFLPQEFDAYDSPPQQKRLGRLDGAQDFGEPLYRGYSSDESYVAEPIRRFNRNNQPSLAGSTAIDADSLKDRPTTRSSPSPPRYFESKKPQLDAGFPPQMPPHKLSTPTAYPSNHVRAMSNASSMQTPRRPPLPSQPLSSGIPITQREIPSSQPTATTNSTPAVKTTKSLAARTASIRNRLTRRKTTSEDTSTPVAPVAPARSSGIAQRLWFRRSSSEQGPVPMMDRSHVEQLGSGTKYSPSTPSFWSAESAIAHGGSNKPPSVLSSPQRSKSERRRPSISATSRSNQSMTSFHSFSGRSKAMTPSDQSALGDDPTSPSNYARTRRPSLSGRLGSSGRDAGSKSEIPPVPSTPIEYVKWESEPEPGGRTSSRWRFGGRRSSSATRSKQEPVVWPSTLSGFDATAAGRRG